jgi:hypothetical protein
MTTFFRHAMCGLLASVVFFVACDVCAMGPDDCKPGYEWKPRSGVGCVQSNCNDIPDAHWGYTQDCVCGSSGSIHENSDDPNIECRYPADHASCPSCVYACVHTGETCPHEKETAPPPIPQAAPQNTSSQQPPATAIQNPPQTPPQTQQPQSAHVPPPVPLATQNVRTETCETACARLTTGGPYDQVIEASGTPPQCKCVVDIADKGGRLTQTITQNGDKRTTYIYDPDTGRLLKTNTISLMEEKERIRKRLGFKYSQEEIDALIDDKIMEQWFRDTTKNIITKTSIKHPQFWWQHFVAWLDHGYGNSIDFVDTHNYGRCGDSMLWLEQKLAGHLKLTGKNDKLSEAMLSITGEKLDNTLNHTALMIRPTGMSNIEWADLVADLTVKTQGGGLSKDDIANLDPRLLNATVLDPYFKKKITVEEFIKGWSVIKVS